MRQSDDRVGAVDQENRVIVHRRQAASHVQCLQDRTVSVHGGISVNCQTSTLQPQLFMPVGNRLLGITIELKIALMHIHLNPRRL